MDALEIATELNRIYDTALTNDLLVALQPNALLADVLLLCVTCRQPIKAVITTERWVKVEWISPAGECRDCVRKAKEERDANRT